MLRAEIHPFFRGASQRFLLLDSNLLLLLITARYDAGLLRGFKRVQMFTQADAALLAWTVDQFKGLATCAYVATEASNLANSLFSATRDGWFAVLADFCLTTREHTAALRSLASSRAFAQFGVTDCALSELNDEEVQILTLVIASQATPTTMEAPC